jgi:hypothetical protein
MDRCAVRCNALQAAIADRTDFDVEEIRRADRIRDNMSCGWP